MKNALTIALLCISAITGIASLLEAKTFTREYIYQASEADSKITSRSIALNQVKTALLEEIGVYIESTFDDTSKEKKSGLEQLSQQQIVSITAGVTETKIIDEKWNGQTYYMKAKINIDIDDVKKKITEIAKDRDKTKELEEVKQKADEAFKQIELLQAKLAKTEDENERLRLQKDYQKNSDNLSAADWFQMGYNADESKEYDSAILYYRKTLNINPKDAITCYNMGIIYFNKGDYNKAIELFEKAIEINPKDADSYNGLGSVYTQKGNYDEAIKIFEKAIRINPKLADTYSNLSNVYTDTGNYDKAIEILNKALLLDPKCATAYFNMGRTYGMKEEFNKAIEMYQKSIDNNIANPFLEQAYYGIGTAYNRNKDYGKAIEPFEMAIAINPKDSEVYLGISSSYYFSGYRDKAISCLKESARLGNETARGSLRNMNMDW